MSAHKSASVCLSSLSPHTIQALHSEDIFTFEQLKDRFEVSEQLFQRLDNSTLLKKLELTNPLDERSQTELSKLISLRKRQAAHDAFSRLARNEFSTNDEDIEYEGDFADEINLDSFFPIQTLFFDVRLIKGDTFLELTPLESIIESFEQEVLENSNIKNFDVYNEQHQKDLLKCFEKKDWPCDSPIYIPIDIAHVYPYVISYLRKKAVLVLSKG